jgi:hypothetical protein
MPIGFDDRLGSFFEIVELTQLVRDARQDLLHGQADRTLSVRNHSQDWNRERLLDFAQQISEVLLSSTVEIASEQDFARERVAQDPKNIVVPERLETVERQDDVTLLGEDILETGRLSQAQSEQFLVAFEQIGDGARSNGDVLVLQSLVDFRDRAVVTVAQGTDESNDIQTELAVRESPGALFLRANGLMVARTGRIGTAEKGQGQAGDILKGGDGALSLVEMPQATAAGRTLLALREQVHSSCDWWAFGAACHDQPPMVEHLIVSASV